MPLKTISLLSYKGGVGKTCIAIDIALHLIKQGKNVFLFDNDILAPSLYRYFKVQVFWFNEYILGNESLNNCIQEINNLPQTSGRLFVSFTRPGDEKKSDLSSFDTQLAKKSRI